MNTFHKIVLALASVFGHGNSTPALQGRRVLGKQTTASTIDTFDRSEQETAETPLIRGIGKALVIGTIISGMLLAPFPAPTVEAQPGDDGALPPPPVPVPTKLYVTGFPALYDDGNFNMSVRFTHPQWTIPCYYWSGVYRSRGSWRWIDAENPPEDWTGVTHNYNNHWINKYYYPGEYNYWICNIVLEGDGVHYSDSSDDWSYAEVWFYPGSLWGGSGSYYHAPQAWVEDSDGDWYYIPVSVNGHEFDSSGQWLPGNPPWHTGPSGARSIEHGQIESGAEEKWPPLFSFGTKFAVKTADDNEPTFFDNCRTGQRPVGLHTD